ncbi:MAG: hypothetical protein QF733_09770 [Phycisphaerales bacterium]|nr:hypothetical protein [Phycisphaerales bacterium]
MTTGTLLHFPLSVCFVIVLVQTADARMGEWIAGIVLDVALCYGGS